MSGDRKVGESCAESWLGLVALGDATVHSATQNGKVTTVAAVDHSSKTVLGLWSEFCTIVTGE